MLSPGRTYRKCQGVDAPGASHILGWEELMDKHPASSLTVEKPEMSTMSLTGLEAWNLICPVGHLSLAFSPTLIHFPTPTQCFLGSHPKEIPSTQILASGSAFWRTQTGSLPNLIIEKHNWGHHVAHPCEAHCHPQKR